MDDFTLVFRTIGERTFEPCKNIVLQKVSAEQVFSVGNTPFLETLRRGYEVGIREKRRWTLFIDGDILLSDQALPALEALVPSLPENVFALKASLFDALLGFVGSFGMMLYRTCYLEKAFEASSDAHLSLKAEKHVIQALSQSGLIYLRWDCPPLGFSDYEQYYKDIFRTAFVHARKHPDWAKHLIPFWRKYHEVNPDYKVALEGYAGGIELPQFPNVQDVAQFPSVEPVLAKLGLSEKRPLEYFSGQIVREKIHHFPFISSMQHRFIGDGKLRILKP